MTRMLFFAAGALLYLQISAQGVPEDKAATSQVAVIKPTFYFKTRHMRKPKDMRIWIHPDKEKLNQSAIIVTDPLTRCVTVYGVNGKLLDNHREIKADGVDVRYGFPLGGEKVDIVAFVSRYHKRVKGRVMVMKVDPVTRKLTRIDDDSILLERVLGGCLYHSWIDGKFYYITADTRGNIEKIQLLDNGQGKVTAKRGYRKHSVVGDGKHNPRTRTLIADDEHNRLYVAVRKFGLVQYPAEPKSGRGKIIARISEANYLRADLEAMAIYYMPNGKGYLMLVSEGNHQIAMYERKSLKYINSFSIGNLASTEGIAVSNLPLSFRYERGMFLCNMVKPDRTYMLVAMPWENVAKGLDPSLKSSILWDPRAVKDDADKQSSGKKRKDR